jgi:molybdopterin synthase catalytic subunit
MSAHLRILIQRDAFDQTAEYERLTKGRTDIGAIVTFTGLCRDEGGTLSALELEHYPAMAEAQITQIAQDAAQRWPLMDVVVIHRFGVIGIGEPIVLVIATSSHRAAAFAGAEYVMDFLKSRAPFWKKDHRADGQQGQWVEARDEDESALGRWQA